MLTVHFVLICIFQLDELKGNESGRRVGNNSSPFWMTIVNEALLCI